MKRNAVMMFEPQLGPQMKEKELDYKSLAPFFIGLKEG